MNIIRQFLYWCKMQYRIFNDPLAFCPHCGVMHNNQQIKYVNDKPIEVYCRDCKKWFAVKGNQFSDKLRERGFDT